MSIARKGVYPFDVIPKRCIAFVSFFFCLGKGDSMNAFEDVGVNDLEVIAISCHLDVRIRSI